MSSLRRQIRTYLGDNKSSAHTVIGDGVSRAFLQALVALIGTFYILLLVCYMVWFYGVFNFQRLTRACINEFYWNLYCIGMIVCLEQGAYGLADATTISRRHHLSLLKSRMVLPLQYGLIQVFLEKRWVFVVISASYFEWRMGCCRWISWCIAL